MAPRYAIAEQAFALGSEDRAPIPIMVKKKRRKQIKITIRPPKRRGIPIPASKRMRDRKKELSRRVCRKKVDRPKKEE